MQNSDGMKKKKNFKKMHAVSMTPHARSTDDSSGPGNPITKNIYKFFFKGATQQNIFMHAVSLTPHARFLH
jgi:hypothetical protein